MSDEPRITYPCDYPIKVVGDAHPDFHDAVRQVVERHDPTMTTERISQKMSRKGNFVSISFMLVAESEQQINALFEELKEIEFVRMVL